MAEQKKHYTYVSNCEKKTVWCTRREYLFIKLCYDDNGLTDVEKEEFEKIL